MRTRHDPRGWGLDGPSYSVPELAHDPESDVLTDDVTGKRVEIDVRDLVQSSLADGEAALRMRLQYEVEVAPDGISDALLAATKLHGYLPPPRLEITYTTP